MFLHGLATQRSGHLHFIGHFNGSPRKRKSRVSFAGFVMAAEVRLQREELAQEILRSG